MVGPNPIGAAPVDYEYDVFISYRHDYPVGPWVREFLYEPFTGWLTQKLGGWRARVFLDQAPGPESRARREALSAGDVWPDRLKQALIVSKCLVPVFSPDYFRSDWCMSEFETFRERERILMRRGLVVPILHNGLNHFPLEAQKIQMFDFSQLRSTMPGFMSTPRGVDFEDNVEKFAADVAMKISQVPSFVTGWPVVEIKVGHVEPQVTFQRLVPAQ